MWGQVFRHRNRNLFEDVRSPTYHADDFESAQFFIDPRPELLRFMDLPECRLITPSLLLFSDNSQRRKITTLRAAYIKRDQGSFTTKIPYGALRLLISLTFAFLPAFAEILPQKDEETHSVESTKTQIISLAAALTYAQESPTWKIDEAHMKGLDFLTQLAMSYGAIVRAHKGTEQPSGPEPKLSGKTTDVAGTTTKLFNS